MSQLLDESMVTIEQKDQEIDDMSEYTSLLSIIDSKRRKLRPINKSLIVFGIYRSCEQLQCA